MLCLWNIRFLSKRILDDGFNALKVGEASMGALAFEHPIQRGFRIEGGEAVFGSRADFAARTQDLPKFYHDTGLFYWFRSEALLSRDSKKMTLADYKVVPVILPRGTVTDIDTEEDWHIAERIFLERDVSEK